jgi:hypothetical protein
MRRRFFSHALTIASALLLIGVFQTALLGAPHPNFIVALNAAQMVPANLSAARGSCMVTSWDIVHINLNCSYSDLTSPLVTADVLQGRAGQSAGPVCISKQFSGSPGTSGTFTLQCGIAYGFPFHPRMMLDKYLNVVLKTASYPDGEIRGQIKIVTLDNDIDGDGRSDLTLFRPQESRSYVLCSADDDTVGFDYAEWDTEEPIPFYADFDGDGFADMSYMHVDWFTGELVTFYLRSSDGTLVQVLWGSLFRGDKRAYGDYDRDGKTDVAVFRDSEGLWCIIPSSEVVGYSYEYWGMAGDRACPADYDGDGRTDLCVIRNEDGYLTWHIRASSDGSYTKNYFGLATDIAAVDNPIDIDADGANDLMVLRRYPTDQVFYTLRSSDQTVDVKQWGLSDRDFNKYGDFDGDGITNIAAVRTENDQLIWFINPGRIDPMRVVYWGTPNDW